MKREWRCTKCEKLLGVLQRGRIHIRFARGHEYLVGLPASSVCRHCRTLNELSLHSGGKTVPPTSASKAVEFHHYQRGARRPDWPARGA